MAVPVGSLQPRLVEVVLVASDACLAFEAAPFGVSWWTGSVVDRLRGEIVGEGTDHAVVEAAQARRAQPHCGQMPVSRLFGGPVPTNSVKLFLLLQAAGGRDRDRRLGRARGDLIESRVVEDFGVTSRRRRGSVALGRGRAGDGCR